MFNKKIIFQLIIVLFLVVNVYAERQEPDFVVGWFTGPGLDSINHPSWEAPHGFNTMITYGLETEIDANIISYLDAVEEANMWLGLEVPRESIQNSDWVNLVSYVNTFKDHNALLFWELYDEPVLNGISVSQFETAYSTIKANDTSNFVSASLNSTSCKHPM